MAADLVGYDGFTRSYALVVGISDYSDGYQPLPTAQDPIRIRDFLINEAGFDYVHVLTEEKATGRRIDELMQNVFPSMVDGDDRFFLYWSGHGIERANRRGGQIGYLPLAASARDDFASMIGMDDIRRWDDLLKGRHVLFLLDACLSGLAGTSSKSDRRQIDLNDLVLPAHHLITAGTSNEETIAGDRWSGSVFTHAFLRAVRGAADTESADFQKDGVVSLYELIEHIGNLVPLEAKIAGWEETITSQLRDLGTSDGAFFFLTDDPKPGPRQTTSAGETEPDQTVTKGLQPEVAAAVDLVAKKGYLTQHLPLKTDPKLSARTITMLKVGDLVEVRQLVSDGAWAKVTTDANVEGYLHMDGLKIH